MGSGNPNAAPGATTSSPGTGGGQAKGGPGNGASPIVDKDDGPKEGPPQGGTPNESDKVARSAPQSGEGGPDGKSQEPVLYSSKTEEGEQLQTTRQYIVASSEGVLGSQPPQQMMEDAVLVSQLPFRFLDDPGTFKNVIYTKASRQEYFPARGEVMESFFNEENPVCPGPKKCEGRILRWFDLGAPPYEVKHPATYFLALRGGKTGVEQMAATVTYHDIAIGPNNQVAMPLIPAISGHLYFVLLLPPGAPVAISPITLKMDQADQAQQFFDMMRDPSYLVSTGMLVKGDDLLDHILERPAKARVQILEEAQPVEAIRAEDSAQKILQVEPTRIQATDTLRTDSVWRLLTPKDD